MRRQSTAQIVESFEPIPFFARLFFGLRRPRRTIFGVDFAGEVEAIGAGIVSFKQGDRVFGMCPSRSNGAQAEYVAVPERTVAAMPAGARFEEAVVCEGAFYANAALKRINLKPGHKILIYGASGAIGTAMVQLAKSAGAAVTAVVATRHLDLVKSLGADHAIDYTSRTSRVSGRPSISWWMRSERLHFSDAASC
jgi:NADPH:quinone reductase-like Zn-dependent oxidoreductase